MEKSKAFGGLLDSWFQKKNQAAADVEYPAYGVTGPSNKEKTSPNGDRKLAHSAQMYHYQHQKQQMLTVEKSSSGRLTSASDVESEEENEEGAYTVYECPGLAPTGEMEVQNPLFADESVQASSQPSKENSK
ncbi:neural proliferation differentiation and control protein 1-like isoform X1 [Tachypleus tridentatus]|uniref:neural proliferation differentiation and control protein 1-like isoform X1 n=1 Tax=Tachypleus tridentatus TaxID=6853 RepID=UPI003FD320D8